MGHNISCMQRQEPPPQKPYDVGLAAAIGVNEDGVVIYKVASHTYKVGDKVFFDCRNDSFVNKKSIWSAIIVKITATNNIKIQFDGVVYPYDTPELGPQYLEFMEIYTLRPATILPRESKPDDDMKTLAWRKHINDNLEMRKQRMSKYRIGQTISFKKWNYQTETNEIHTGIITSTDYAWDSISVSNKDGENLYVSVEPDADITIIE